MNSEDAHFPGKLSIPSQEGVSPLLECVNVEKGISEFPAGNWEQPSQAIADTSCAVCFPVMKYISRTYIAWFAYCFGDCGQYCKVVLLG